MVKQFRTIRRCGERSIITDENGAYQFYVEEAPDLGHEAETKWELLEAGPELIEAIRQIELKSRPGQQVNVHEAVDLLAEIFQIAHRMRNRFD